MDAFRRNQVNGPVLNTLDYQDFKEIGVLSGLHIKVPTRGCHSRDVSL